MKYVLLSTLLQECKKKLQKLHSMFIFIQFLNTIEIIVSCFIIPQIHLL